MIVVAGGIEEGEHEAAILRGRRVGIKAGAVDSFEGECTDFVGAGRRWKRNGGIRMLKGDELGERFW